MRLVSIEEVRALVASPLPDEVLLDIVDRVEGEITEAVGVPYDGTTTLSETIAGGIDENIFVKRPINSITSVTEFSSIGDATGTALVEATDFLAWPNQGRIERIAVKWGHRATVVYLPQDQRNKRKRAIIDLVRLTLAETAFKQESVGGEYAYTSPPNWDAERRRVMRRLSFRDI